MPALQAPDLECRGRVRPIRPGCSFGLAHRVGTLGLVVASSANPGPPLLLSSSHVLNLRPDGRPYLLFQPAGGDRVRGDSPVARAFRYTRLDPATPNHHEAGLAIPLRPDLVDPDTPLGPLRGTVSSLRPGMRLWKLSRTSGLGHGVVEAVDWAGFVRISGRRYPFARQAVIRGMGRPISLVGDSGSVWITEDGEAAAMNFAGFDDGRISIATPISIVLEGLNVQLAAVSDG